jgi:hypothetical protein
VAWRVHAWDGNATGPWSPWCRFAVDNAPPGPPVLSSMGAPAFPAAPPASTVAGAPVSVTVTPAAGDTDVAGYLYGVGPVDTVPTAFAPAGPAGTATIPVVPVVSGLAKNFLSVVAMDRAGNRSPVMPSVPSAPGTRQFRAHAAPVTGRVAGDLTGDGRADVTTIADVVGGRTMAWTFDGGGPAIAHPPVSIMELADGRAALRATGDFDGDRRAEIASLNGLGGSGVSLSLLRGTGNALAETVLAVGGGAVPLSAWTLARCRLLAGDVTGDGLDDLVCLYDLGSATWQLRVLRATGTPGAPAFAAPEIWYTTGAGTSDWANVKPLLADFTGDGRADFGQFYNHSAAGAWTRMWLHRSSGTTFGPEEVFWDKPAGTFYWQNSKFIAGDFTGDGKADVAAFYRFSLDRTALLLIETRPDGSGMKMDTQPWTSYDHGWRWDAIEPSAGDVDGDGRLDVNVVYRCCGPGQAKLWTFAGTGSSFAPPTRLWAGSLGYLGTGSTATVDGVRYQLVNRATGQCLAVAGGSAAGGAGMVQQPCDAGNLAALFHPEPTGGGQVLIRPAHATGMCVGVPGGSVADGPQLAQAACGSPPGGDQVQQWEYLSGWAEVTVLIRLMHSNKCVGVANASTAPGAPAVQWPCGAFDHEWTLRPV